jgi:hypothetical protein
MRNIFILLSVLFLWNVSAQEKEGGKKYYASLSAGYQVSPGFYPVFFDIARNFKGDVLSLHLVWGYSFMREEVPDTRYGASPGTRDVLPVEKMYLGLHLNMHFQKFLRPGNRYDPYWGIHLGKNLGGQIGFAYAFAPSWKFYTEAVFPLLPNTLEFFNLTQANQTNESVVFEKMFFRFGVMFNVF